MTEGKRNIIQQLLEAYDIQTTEALKDLLGGTIREMMEAEMDYTDPQLGTGVWSVKHHV